MTRRRRIPRRQGRAVGDCTSRSRRPGRWKTSLVVVTSFPAVDDAVARPRSTPNTPRTQTNSAQTPNARRNGISRRSAKAWTSATGRWPPLGGWRPDRSRRRDRRRSAGAGFVVGRAPGQVVLGSTADRLLHSSPVPVAISPRGYRATRGGELVRVTCAYSGTAESVRVVERVAALAAQLDVADEGGQLRHARPNHVSALGRPANRGLAAGRLGGADARERWPN